MTREQIYNEVFDKLYIELNQSYICEKISNLNQLIHDLMNKPSDIVIRNHKKQIKEEVIIKLIKYTSDLKFDTTYKLLNKSYTKPGLKEYMKIIIEALKNHNRPDFLMIKSEDVFDLSCEMFENFQHFEQEMQNTDIELIEVGKEDRHIFKTKIMGAARYFILKSPGRVDVKVIIGPYIEPIMYYFN